MAKEIKADKKVAGKKKTKKSSGTPKDEQASGKRKNAPANGGMGEVDAATKAKMTEEAIQIVLEGIDRPDMQNNGKAFIPKDWHSTFKPALGQYKQWLLEHKDTFTIIPKSVTDFIVVRKGCETASVTVTEKWQKALIKAWLLYCKDTTKDKRDIDEFTAAIPKASERAAKKKVLHQEKKAKTKQGDGIAEGEDDESDGEEEEAAVPVSKPPAKSKGKKKRIKT